MKSEDLKFNTAELVFDHDFKIEHDGGYCYIMLKPKTGDIYCPFLCSKDVKVEKNLPEEMTIKYVHGSYTKVVETKEELLKIIDNFKSL